MASCLKLFPHSMNGYAERFRVYLNLLISFTTPIMLITITANTPSPKYWSPGLLDRNAHKPSNNKGDSISIITVIKAAIKQPLDFWRLLVVVQNACVIPQNKHGTDGNIIGLVWVLGADLSIALSQQFFDFTRRYGP